jgi:glutathione S-transferase
VPPFAQGQVRDLRPRWALAEAGIAYAVRKLDAMAERPADYYQEQPFGQVPSYRDDTVSLFESGAIVLHIGRDCETLLPADPAARARPTAWLIAALNSVEPYLMLLATIDIIATGEEWARLRRPGVIEMIDKRLSRLSDALDDKAYLDGDRFTAGDLIMTTVTRQSIRDLLTEAVPEYAIVAISTCEELLEIGERQFGRPNIIVVYIRSVGLTSPSIGSAGPVTWSPAVVDEPW